MTDETITTAAERFPSDDVELEPGRSVWIDAGIVRGHADLGSTASQGCEILGVDGDELTVEYPDHGDMSTATIGIEHVRETDLQEGEEVVVSYNSAYSDARQEKTGAVEYVQRGRHGFSSLGVVLDGTEYRISPTGAVTSRETNRQIGGDAIVERVESDDDEKLVTDGGTPNYAERIVRSSLETTAIRWRPSDLEESRDDEELVTDGGRRATGQVGLEAFHADQTRLDEHEGDVETDGGHERPELEAFDHEERGRLRHHTRQGNYSTVLRVAGVTGPRNQSDFREVADSLEAFVEHHEEHGDFLDVHGVGPSTNETLEAAVPVVREELDELEAEEGPA